MPVIFKIFLFLFLQQGASVLKDVTSPGSDAGFSVEIKIDGRPMNLQAQADQMTVNELISLCSLPGVEHDTKIEMLPDGMTGVEIRFTCIKDKERERIMERVKHLLNRGVSLRWIEQGMQ